MASYEDLKINISADVSNASRGLKSLSKNLSTLQDTIKGLDLGLIDNLQKHLQKIAKIDFSNVSQGLKDIVSAFKMIEHQANKKTIGKKLENSIGANNGAGANGGVGGVETESDKVANDVQQAYNLFRELAKYEPQVAEKMKTMFEGIDNGSLENAKEQVEKMIISLQQLVNAEDIGNQKTTEKKQTLQKALSILKQMKSMATQDSIDKSTKGIKKFFDAFKRVAFYRIVRRGLQMIMQSIKEGIQNMALFDSSFNKTMSNLKSSFSYLKNATMTAVAPLIQMVEPFITALTDGLAEIMNMLGELFSAIAGKDYFAKATKGAEDYAESLKKAKNQALGIDELNVLNAEEQAQNFENAEVGIESNGAMGSFFADFGATLRDFIEKLKVSIEPIIEAIGRLFDAIAPILDVIMEIVGVFVEDTMDSVNDSIASFIDMIADILKYIKLVFDALSPILYLVNDIVAFLLNTFNQTMQILFETISSCLPLLEPALTLIKGILEAVFSKDGVIGSILSKFEDFTKGFGDLFTGDGTFAQILKVINDILTKIGNKVVKGALGGLGIGYYDLPKWEQALLGIASLGLAPLLGLIGKHANGGFVEDGLFMANHNELIGQFSNGKTAVANNEMITDGIYRAVLQAMTESAQGNNGKIVIQIDGREIARTVDKYNKQSGNAGFVGGYNNG